MMKMVETLWMTAPDWLPSPLDELELEDTIECEPPTLPSVLSADAAWELAQTALETGDYEEAKAYMQYYNEKTRML